MLLSLLTAAAALSGAVPSPDTTHRAAEPVTWTIDVSHSELTFEIRHFVSRVRGQFDRWGGTVTMDGTDWSTARIAVQIQANSIDTNHERRDADLRGAEFFHADSFPVITFTSSRIERTGDRARIHGVLTMRGVMRSIVLEGQHLGAMTANGRERMGFEATTTIDRREWGIVWNRAIEGGGVTLGDDVKISMTIALTRPVAAGGAGSSTPR